MDCSLSDPQSTRSSRVIIMDAYYAVGFQFKYVFNKMCWYGKSPWTCFTSLFFQSECSGCSRLTTNRQAHTHTQFSVLKSVLVFPLFLVSFFGVLWFTHHWNGTRVIGLKSMTSTIDDPALHKKVFTFNTVPVACSSFVVVALRLLMLFEYCWCFSDRKLRTKQ